MLSITSLLLTSASAAAMTIPATAAAADVATAQDAQTESDAGVAADVIIVQARRRDEAVQDVPAVINVVAAGSMRARMA